MSSGMDIDLHRPPLPPQTQTPILDYPHRNTLIPRAIADGHRLELYVLVTPEYDFIERDLISRTQPPWNKKGIC